MIDHHFCTTAETAGYEETASWPVKNLLILLWLFVVIPLSMWGSWKSVLCNLLTWMDFFTAILLLMFSMLRCLTIEGSANDILLLDNAPANCTSNSRIFSFIHLSGILWGSSIYFEGRSVILLGKRLVNMRSVGQQSNLRNSFYFWATAVGTSFMATVFAYHFVQVYYQTHSNPSFGLIAKLTLPTVGLVEGGKIVLQGLLLCGYLQGLDMKCADMSVQRDFHRIAYSNFVMLINCMGLVYSFSPLHSILSDNGPLEYVQLASMLIDIGLRVAHGVACFYMAHSLKPVQAQSSIIQDTTLLYYLYKLDDVVFNCCTKLYREAFYLTPLEAQDLPVACAESTSCNSKYT